MPNPVFKRINSVKSLNFKGLEYQQDFIITFKENSKPSINYEKLMSGQKIKVVLIFEN